jgi:cyanate permease
MEPASDELNAPLIRVQPPHPARGDLLAMATFWLALTGNLTIECGWLQLPRVTHGPSAMLAHGLMNVGTLFAIAAFFLTLLLVVRRRNSTRISRLAVCLSLVGMMLVLLAPAA